VDPRGRLDCCAGLADHVHSEVVLGNEAGEEGACTLLHTHAMVDKGGIAAKEAMHHDAHAGEGMADQE
jgi:hypothetical protein